MQLVIAERHHQHLGVGLRPDWPEGCNILHERAAAQFNALPDDPLGECLAHLLRDAGAPFEGLPAQFCLGLGYAHGSGYWKAGQKVEGSAEPHEPWDSDPGKPTT